MRWLTQDAVLTCPHESGLVGIAPSQRLVTVQSRAVLVANDPEQKPIAGCPWVSPGMKPCTSTLKVTRGYSSWIRIQGRRVCLDTVTGLTDGTPPGTFFYNVRSPGQSLVRGR
ncbi:MAG: hypothetical protein AAFU65_09655 [Pseudomonadota bacterium]